MKIIQPELILKGAGQKRQNIMKKYPSVIMVVITVIVTSCIQYSNLHKIIGCSHKAIYDKMGVMVKKRYPDDYETVVTADEEGRERKKAVYRGDYFEFTLDQDGLLNFRRKCFLLLAAIAGLHFASGFVNSQGMYQFYVALPYVLAFFPLMYMAAGIFRLPKEKRQYRRDEIGLSFERVKTTSHVLLFLLGIGILGEIAFLLFLSIQDQRTMEYLYLALQLLTAATAYFLICLQKQILIQPFTEQ